jgi:hypothetical protein
VRAPEDEVFVTVTLRTTEVAFWGTLTPPIARMWSPPGVSRPPSILVSRIRTGLRPVYTLSVRKVKVSSARVALVPPGVVTVTSVLPAACGGLTAVICEPDTNVKLEAFVDPKLTAVAPVNPHPVIETLLPPVDGPDVGETLVTIGVLLSGALLHSTAT